MEQARRVALIHDWLVDIAGSERVLAAIAEMYPDAPLYVLLHDKDGLKNTPFAGREIHHTFIQRLPFARRKYRNYLPFFPLAVEQHEVHDYDLILSSSHAVAKGVLTHAAQLHICYCHTPIRYAWDLHHQYLREARLTRGIKGALARWILHHIRIWDAGTAPRVDYFIANSHYIAARIKRVYGREAAVIYPPVAVEDFTLCTDKEDFYFTASRFVPYKKIDLIVEAFAQMPDKRLIVVGDGTDFRKVKRIAQHAPNVQLLGYQPFAVLRDYLQRARAFVFAAEEDFGILPVEAQACGTPVIAFGKGGVRETVVEGITGLFFEEQSPAALIRAVNTFEAQAHQFDYRAIRTHAEQFAKARFLRELRQFIDEKWQDFQSRQYRPR